MCITLVSLYDARSLYCYTMMHGHYTAILWCTVTILIYYNAWSLYWYIMMHGHYTDILWCTVTILIYYDAQSSNYYVHFHLKLQIDIFLYNWIHTGKPTSNFHDTYIGLTPLIMLVTGIRSVSNTNLLITRKFGNRRIRIHTPIGKLKKYCHLPTISF
jgi:hypothetical protein